MAQRHEVEGWVNPSAWDDEDQARDAIEAIMASGSDDEADWIRIVEQVTGDDLEDETLAAASRDYDRAARVLDGARERLYAAMRQARARGVSAARIAEATSMSRQRVTTIVRR